jgi:DNA polymerase
MQDLFLDFESYYDGQCSLKPLTTPEYINHPDFFVHLCTVAVDDGDVIVLHNHQECVDYFATVDWANTRLIAHNAKFDAAVLAWVYGHNPAEYMDTMGLAKYFLPGRGALKHVAKALALPDKGDALHKTQGLKVIPTEIMAEFIDYGIQDTILCREIYRRMATHLPDRERYLIHITIKMFVEPRFVVNQPLLREYAASLQRIEELKFEEIRDRVQQWSDDFGWGMTVTAKTFTSNPQMVELLTRLEIPIPYKYRNATATEIAKGVQQPGSQVRVPALAKGDEEFQTLMERYSGTGLYEIFELRLMLKSRIEQTRTQRFLRISEIMGGRIPVPLNYCGAKTNRWSGADKVNMQNLSSRGKPTTLRESLQAPPGYKLVVADLAQIEPRVLATMAGEQALIDAFRNGSDIYKLAASGTFKIDVDQVTKQQRQIGKAQVLGLGYGMWAKGFRVFAKTIAGEVLTESQAKDVVMAYRNQFTKIVEFWDNCEQGLKLLAAKKPGATLTLNQCTFATKPFPCVILPSGNYLKYPNLRAIFKSPFEETQVEGFEYGMGGVYSKVYGALMVENIVQSLSRDILGDMIVRLGKLMQADEQFVNLVHDEVVMVIREDRAEWFAEETKKIMRVNPEWFPDVPLDCTVDIGDNYAEAK